MIRGATIVYWIAGFIVAVGLFSGALYLVNSNGLMPGAPEEIQETGRLVASEGLNIEGVAAGERVVFERYRLFDEDGDYELVGPEGNVNISRDNAEVTVVNPDGTTQDITSDLWFVPFKVVPGMPEGIYKLVFELKTGEVYEQELSFGGSNQVNLVATGNTRIQPAPDINPDGPITSRQRLYLYDLEHGDRDSIELTAFGLDGVDLNEASSIVHIDPYNTVRDLNTAEFYKDGYMWLDLVKISIIQQGEHIFMAKVGDAWNYAVVNYPEDF